MFKKTKKIGCKLAGCKSAVASCTWLQIGGCKLAVANRRLQIGGCKSAVANRRLQVGGCKSAVANCRVPPWRALSLNRLVRSFVRWMLGIVACARPPVRLKIHTNKCVCEFCVMYVYVYYADDVSSAHSLLDVLYAHFDDKYLTFFACVRASARPAVRVSTS